MPLPKLNKGKAPLEDFKSIESLGVNRQLTDATDEADKVGLVILLITACGIGLVALIRYFL